LAVVLLAEHPAVLASDTDWMAAFLRETGVVDDPPAALAEVHLGHYPLAHATQHLGVRPLRLGHEVVQRLVPGTHVHRIDSRDHGLNLATQKCIGNAPRWFIAWWSSTLYAAMLWGF
jgi:hypothetical protein